jgi:hypothetical protein
MEYRPAPGCEGRGSTQVGSVGTTLPRGDTILVATNAETRRWHHNPHSCGDPRDPEEPDHDRRTVDAVKIGTFERGRV